MKSRTSFLLEKCLSSVWMLLLAVLVTGGNGRYAILSRIHYSAALALLLTFAVLRFRGDIWPGFLRKFLSVLVKAPLVLPSLLYVVFFTLEQIQRYRSFNANAFDLSFIAQGLWSTVHGEGFLHLTALHDTNFLAYHFAPILAVLSPVFLLPYPMYILFLLQAVLVCSGTYFLYELCKLRSISRPVTVLVLALYLLYQPLWLSNFFDFREDLFFIPCVFGMFVARERKSYWALWAFALLAFFVKENAAIAVFGMGFILITDGKKSQGSLLAAVSVILFVLLNGLIMPKIAPDHRTTMAVSKLAGLGPDVHSILATVVQSPWQSFKLVLGVMFDADAARYLVKIFLPFLPLFLFARREHFLVLLPAVVLVLMNLLINSTHSLGFHYEIILVPFLFVFLVQALPGLIDRVGRSSAAAFLILFSLLSYGVSPVRLFRDFRVAREQVQLEKILEDIPRSASVTAQTSVHPHICDRKVVRIFSEAKNLNEDYVILSTFSGLSQYGHPRLSEEMSKIDSYGYRLLIDLPVAKVWCRKAICPATAI